MATRSSPAVRSLFRKQLCTRHQPKLEFAARSYGIARSISINNSVQPQDAARNSRIAVCSGQKRTASSSSSGGVKQLPLDAFHRSHGAKMVEFAGHQMPLVYADQTHLQSHHWTREKASLFDVGHMLQHTFTGPQAEQLLHRLTPSYLPSLAPFESVLSVLLHPDGGIVDDAMITRLDKPNAFRLVSNGATSSKVSDYIKSELASTSSGQVDWKTSHSHDSGLLALQGPLSLQVLSSLLSPLDRKQLTSLYFGQSLNLSLRNVAGGPVFVSRGGYTGEDGFELATSSPAQTVALAEALYQAGGNGENLRLAGLGARDSLRLEAGMCLYGHDLDDTTTPVEAALGWVVGKERRKEGGFLGDKTILPQLLKKSEGGKPVTRKRVGLTIDGSPAREGAVLYAPSATGQPSESDVIGVITSGGPSPTLGKNIAMGYIKSPAFAKLGTEVKVLVRGKLRTATVSKMPFVETKYYRAIVGGGEEKIKITTASTQGAAPA